MKTDSVNKGKGGLLTNKEIVLRYFTLLQNNDIDGLKNLFWSDAIVYEPFSKSEQGLRGWSQIEPFLKVAIMANESLSSKIRFEESSHIKNKDHDGKENNVESRSDIVEALVTFQKDNVLAARFRFELINRDNTIDNSEQKKIKTLRIQFM
jgi:ketosteroid isomerase-like protein